MKGWRLLRGTRHAAAGFTLIELIVVIVILGVLTATALPKFMDLRSDAVLASVRGTEAAVHSAKNFLRARCALSSSCNLSSGASTVVHQGVTYAMYHGWPDAGDNLNGSEIDRAMTVSGVTVSLTGGNAHRWSPTAAKDATTCYVEYREVAAAGGDPTVSTVTTGC